MLVYILKIKLYIYVYEISCKMTIEMSGKLMQFGIGEISSEAYYFLHAI